MITDNKLVDIKHHSFIMRSFRNRVIIEGFAKHKPVSVILSWSHQTESWIKQQSIQLILHTLTTEIDKIVLFYIHCGERKIVVDKQQKTSTNSQSEMCGIEY
jgi:hypothetical protein